MATLPQTANAFTTQQLEEDTRERRRIVQQILADGPARLEAELARLRSVGVIDEAGNRISTELPPDMMPGADRDFGG
jgi:hypothetical protein